MILDVQNLYIPDSGVAISKHPNGILSIHLSLTVPASQDGWSSEAISIPTTSVSNDEFVYVRGDGCSFHLTLTQQMTGSILVDTGSMGTLCLQSEFAQSEALIVPIIYRKMAYLN